MTRLPEYQEEETVACQEVEASIEVGQEVEEVDLGDTEKIAPTMNMDMKVKEEEAEEVIHQRQDTEEETPAITNEGGAQGP